MIPHIIVIQSAYTDPELSARRLAITEHTSVVSLRFQAVKPVIHLAVSVHDPHQQQRVDLFRSTGCKVKVIEREGWKLYNENWELPEGRKIVGRLDDDDVLAKDFVARNLHEAPESGECALLWPKGFVFWRSQIFHLNHAGNQFVALVTDRQTDPHQQGHWRYVKNWPHKVVSWEPGWIWVRHGDAASSTLPRYRTKRVGRIDSTRIPVNLRAIERAIEPSGMASGDYKQHRRPAVLQHVLTENRRNNP